MIHINRSSAARWSGENGLTVSDGPLTSCYANDPEMREIITLFVAEIPERRRELTDAWTGGDLSRVRTLAHQIKGAAGGYGFPDISVAAARLETAASNATGDGLAASAPYDALMALLARVEVA